MRPAGIPFPGCDLAEDIPATLPDMERFCLQVEAVLADKVRGSDRFAVQLLLRESLINAVVHGSGSDASRRVRCIVRMRGDRIAVYVADDGPGFDWKAALNAPADPAATSGRGIRILQQYSDTVSYNARGNRLFLRKRLHVGKGETNV